MVMPRILREIDRAAGIPGAIGAILRRERLCSSAITDWRRQREAGGYEGLTRSAVCWSVATRHWPFRNLLNGHTQRVSSMA